MKRNFKITAIMLMLIFAGSMTLSAQRGMRGMGPDSTMRSRMEQMQRPEMGMRQGMAGMPHNMMPQYVMRNQRMGFGQPGFGMRQPGRGMRGRMPSIYNIPDLTDKQKKDIADLRGKQQAEIEKLRIDMQSKMKALREDHRARVMDLLNADQKKWLEENIPAPETKK